MSVRLSPQRLVAPGACVDEHSSATVHTRRSYAPEEFRWAARFVDIISPGTTIALRSFDFSRLHDTQPADL